MELKALEEVAGILMAFALVGVVVLLRDQRYWWILLPGIIFLAAATMMWRVKLAQRAARLLGEDPQYLQELERRSRA